MRRSGLALAVAVVGCAPALAACGSSGNHATSASASFLKFSVCMRAHGVSKFPDPSSGGGIRLFPGSGLNPLSPTFQSAQLTCKKDLPGGGPPPITETQKRQALAFAECMRTHGVPNFPDPIFPASGGVMQGAPGVSDAPAFEHAAKACGGPGVRLR